MRGLILTLPHCGISAHPDRDHTASGPDSSTGFIPAISSFNPLPALVAIITGQTWCMWHLCIPNGLTHFAPQTGSKRLSCIWFFVYTVQPSHLWSSPWSNTSHMRSRYLLYQVLFFHFSSHAKPSQYRRNELLLKFVPLWVPPWRGPTWVEYLLGCFDFSSFFYKTKCQRNRLHKRNNHIT